MGQIIPRTQIQDVTLNSGEKTPKTTEALSSLLNHNFVPHEAFAKRVLTPQYDVFFGLFISIFWKSFLVKIYIQYRAVH